jgi:hypothetical protein
MEEIIIDTFHLFLYGDTIEEYPGWTKRGNTWIYEPEKDLTNTERVV